MQSENQNDDWRVFFDHEAERRNRESLEEFLESVASPSSQTDWILLELGSPPLPRFNPLALSGSRQDEITDEEAGLVLLCLEIRLPPIHDDEIMALAFPP